LLAAVAAETPVAVVVQVDLEHPLELLVEALPQNLRLLLQPEQITQ
jgi:hypothetical protein